MSYTKEQIERLLTRFMDGTTTLGEEDVLRRYFREADVPAEWADYRLLFEELETMAPQPAVQSVRYRRLWWGAAVAAAAVAAVVTVVAPWRATPPAQELAVVSAESKADSVAVEQSAEQRPATAADTASVAPVRPSAPQPSRRSLRKAQPTQTDYDKAYALMAEAEEGRRQAQQQLAQARLEIAQAQLAAAGFIPVQEEDGSIIYINEQTELMAYEE